MLSPDAETRMLIACYLRGDLSVHDLRRQVTAIAWRLDAESLEDHLLTSKAILYLHDFVFGHGTEADLADLVRELFQDTRPAPLLATT
jgi:hypothetical protein